MCVVCKSGQAQLNSATAGHHRHQRPTTTTTTTRRWRRHLHLIHADIRILTLASVILTPTPVHMPTTTPTIPTPTAVTTSTMSVKPSSLAGLSPSVSLLAAFTPTAPAVAPRAYHPHPTPFAARVLFPGVIFGIHLIGLIIVAIVYFQRQKKRKVRLPLAVHFAPIVKAHPKNRYGTVEWPHITATVVSHPGQPQLVRSVMARSRPHCCRTTTTQTRA